MASNNNEGQQQNMEVINMISYIEQTMKTIKNFGEQLKIQLDTNLIQIGHVINVSKKTFTKGIFQILNISTPKVYNKRKLNKELELFYRLLEPKAYFKDNKNTYFKIFKSQKKEKQTSNKSHHAVLTYTEVTRRELEKEHTKMKEKPYNNLTKSKRTTMGREEKIL